MNANRSGFSMIMRKLTITTAVNSSYEFFIAPFIASSLYWNKEAEVLISVENEKAFLKSYEQSLDIIQKEFPDRVMINQRYFGHIMPNTIRFISEQPIETEFTYIGDVDILILEDILTYHLERLAKTGLPYSNHLRKGQRALTGLHFTRTDAYYPIPDLNDLDLIGRLDEEILFDLVRFRGLALPQDDDSNRVQHGYHLSLNRRPSSKLGWSLHRNYLFNFIEMINGPLWAKLFPTLDKKFQRLLALLLFQLEAKYPDDTQNITMLKSIKSKIFID